MNNFRHKYIKYKTKYINLQKKSMVGGNAKVKQHLALCEKLNFEGANKHNEQIVRQIYDKNVLVRMSSGETITGIDQLLKFMMQMYKLAPDCKIVSHGIQFGSGDWTAVIQNMQGTFTGDLKTPDGKVIPPTGKEFKMEVLSLLKWKDNKIIEERDYWDEGTFNKQIGVSNCKLFEASNQKGGAGKITNYPTFDSGEGDDKVRKNLARSEQLSAESANTPEHFALFKKLHDQNVVVRSSDGTVIKGLDKHFENMKQMYLLAPDVKVKQEVQFGSGDWIASGMIMTGTFTGVLKIPGKEMKEVKGTGKKFKMYTAVLMHWKNDKIVEFISFWDNDEFAKQIGVSAC